MRLLGSKSKQNAAFTVKIAKPKKKVVKNIMQCFQYHEIRRFSKFCPRKYNVSSFFTLEKRDKEQNMFWCISNGGVYREL